MGYRPNGRHPANDRPRSPECQHEPVEVDNDEMPHRRWLCARCLKRVVPLRPPGVPIERATWRLHVEETM